MNFQQISDFLDSQDVWSKKELLELYGIATLNTVADTLKACGLQTSKTRYTTDEIKTRFHQARIMLAQGQTYADVASHFRPKAKEVSNAQEPVNVHGHAQNQMHEGANVGTELAMQMLSAILQPQVAAVVQQVAVPLTGMFLVKELNSPEFKKIVQQQLKELSAVSLNQNDLLMIGMEQSGLVLPQGEEETDPNELLNSLEVESKPLLEAK